MSKKRILLIAFILACNVVLAAIPVAADSRVVSIEAVFGKTKFMLNGEPLKMDSLLYDGAAYLPAAYIARELGLSARWEPAENHTYLAYSYSAAERPDVTGTVRNDPETIIIDAVFGSTKYFLNGKTLEQECLVYDGTAYLPASYLAKELDLHTNWNPETNITNITYIPVTGIQFNEAKVLMGKNTNASLQPEIIPYDASIKTVSYKSNNENVITVNENGELYAKGDGSAVITCTSVNGVTASINVETVIPVTSISVRPERNTYQVGETAKFAIVVYPSDATDKSYILSSDDESTVINGDYAVLNRSGQTNFTVMASNGVSHSCSVHVVNLEEFAAEVLRLTNIERTSRGLTPLSGNNSILNSAAKVRSSELIDSYSHTRPDGRKQSTTYEELGGTYTGYYAGIGENIYSGPTTPQEAVDGWMNSEGHKKNILNSNYTHMGVGVVIDSSGWFYWVQSFYG